MKLLMQQLSWKILASNITNAKEKKKDQAKEDPLLISAEAVTIVPQVDHAHVEVEKDKEIAISEEKSAD